MQTNTDASKTKLLNLIEILPLDKTKEAELLLKSLIPKGKTKNKLKKSKSQQFNEWLEGRPVGEPLTPEEDIEIEEAKKQYRRGNYISFDEHKKRLGK